MVGWNPETAGFEAVVVVFDADHDTGPGPMAVAGHHDSWTLGAPSTSIPPAVIVFGCDQAGRAASEAVGRDKPGPDGRPWCRRSLCLTVDSLIDGLRFEGFRFDAADTERLSELAEEVERCHGPILLRGRKSMAGSGPRTRIRLEHTARPAGLIVYDGHCHDRADLLEAARCIIELCWSRCWTAIERDLSLALMLDVLTEVRHDFCFSPSDVALWCLAGRRIPNLADVPVGAGPAPVPDQLRLSL